MTEKQAQVKVLGIVRHKQNCRIQDGPGLCDCGALASQVPAQPPAQGDEQIKYMVNRFLSWRLPENFNPDGGISFKPLRNQGTPYEGKNEPVGTNLLDATQAEEMIRYLMDGLPAPVPAQGTPPAHDGGNLLAAAQWFMESPAPASLQIADTLEQECHDLVMASDWTVPALIQALVPFIRTKLRAALAESDKALSEARNKVFRMAWRLPTPRESYIAGFRDAKDQALEILRAAQPTPARDRRGDGPGGDNA